ncbi:autotransporter-associated beta strand repeat-containing protein [Oleiagrimonas soli]|uniref:Autotransporter-associated beta strand protein n=1 Tax=Oleiagrimonas soli TaxID=1543381 RepID=A0A841KMH5_9GAMM|nr:autotransporter-associated beta strand repeat-containing protein [Oleiagrimonas soli]MBB6183258.1 autotransporter-associated beta strand protein [Oleiagrimonas soli]
MNKVYRLVWNRALGAVQVASEWAKSPCDGASSVSGVSSAGPARNRLAQACVVALALAAGMAASPLHAATFTVTEATDDGTGTTAGSLSWAIAQANANPGSTIQVQLSSGNTITLTGGALSVTAPVTIDDASDLILQVPLGGDGAITWAGSGTLTLAGNHTSLTGGMTVGGGSLQLGESTGTATISMAQAAAGMYGGGAFGAGAAGGNGTTGVYAASGSSVGIGAGSVIGGSMGGTGGGGITGGAESIPGRAGGSGGYGGAAVYGQSFMVSNIGSVTGGSGGSGGYGGSGGEGNQGYTDVIGTDGKPGGTGGDGGIAGAGASAISGASFSVTNTGTITGGVGGVGGSGGIGGSGGTGGNGSTYEHSGGAAGNGGAGGRGGPGAVGGAGGSAISGSSFTLSNSGSLLGGAGGQGGQGGNGGAGGRGGNGGYSGYSGAYRLYTTGDGGNGGNGGAGGRGGIGGAGSAAVSGEHFTLTNTGSISGGDGGLGGAGGGGGPGGQGGSAGGGAGSGTTSGTDGVAGSSGAEGTAGTGGLGGVGVIATGGATIYNGGSIAGGRADGGSGAQADAIDFSGGGNTLVIEAGASFIGNVVSTSGSTNGGDVLALGGTSNSSFDISSVGTGQPYQGFNLLEKTGTATWTVTGSNSSGLGWHLNGGTLSISSATGTELGSYAVTFNGGALLTTGAATLNQNISLVGNGSFDNGGYNDTLSGVISGNGGIGFGGAGTTTLTGSNTYTGSTDITGGTLKGGVADAFSAASHTTVNTGSVLDLGGFAQTITTVNLAGGTVQNGSLTGVVASTGGTIGNLSGSASLIVTGGITTLTGTNTYAGGTTLNAGTLIVNTSSLPGDVTDHAALVFNQTANGNFAGVISGSGSVTKTGSGTLILTGANTYSGGTIISDGILEGDTTSLQGRIDDNAALVFNQNVNDTFADTISGSGSVTKTGTGTLILAGANTYSGGTTINAGTLEGSTTSLQGRIDDNAALAFNQTANGTFAGTISGSGSVTKTGSGALILTGANTYSGGTTISDGTLEGSATSLQGSIIDNASLVFNQTSNGNFSGAISGSGSMVKAGSGTLVLSGATTYTGATRLIGGSLVGAADHVFSAASSTTVNAGTVLDLGGFAQAINTLNLAGGTVQNGSLSGAMTSTGGTIGNLSGSASLTVVGGTTTLIGTNAYTGGTRLSAGTLVVGDASHTTASVAGDVTVGAGGTLRGHGTVEGNVGIDGGVMMPGGSIGVFTVAGNYVQSSAGTLNLEITPDTTAGMGYSQLQVGGSASLDGNLVVTLDTGMYLANTSYDLVHAAGGVNGTFATTTLTPALATYLTSTVTYGANDVRLTLAPNERAYPDDFPDYASNVSIGVEQSFQAVLGRMNPQAEARNGAWGQYVAGWGGLSQGSRYTQNGGAVGVGRSVNGKLVLGLAIAGGTTTTTLSPMQVRAKPLGGFVYGIWREGGLRLAGSVGFGHLQQRSRRHLNGMGVQIASSTGRYDGFALRGDYSATVGAMQLSPYIGFDYVKGQYGASQEHGLPLLALNYSKTSQHLSHYQAGLRVGTSSTTWKPWVQLGMEGWGGDRSVTVTESLGGYQKQVTSNALPRTALSGGVGVDWHDGPWGATLAWHSAWASNYHGNSGMLQILYRW